MIHVMKIFETNKDTKERLETQEARIDELETSAQKLATDLDAAKAELTDRDQTIAEQSNQIATLTDTLATKDAELATLNASLAEQVEATKEAEESASSKAVEIAASAGHEPVEVPDESIEEDVLAKFNSLSGAAATAYFKKNREAIRVAQINQ